MKKIAYFLILTVAGLLCSNIVFAAASIPYSVSFTGCSSDVFYSSVNGGYGCGDASATYNNINGTSSSTVCSPYYQQISTAANYPSGAGGRGFRRYYCGSNTAATGSISFNVSPTNEIWMRFYIRMEAGFQWSGFSWLKLINVTPICQNFWMDVTPNGVLIDAMGGAGLTTGGNATFCQSAPNCGWNQMNPKGIPSGGLNKGDGSWHSVEIHMKDQTGSGTFDGQFDIWFDGTLVGHTAAFNYNLGAPQGISRIQFFANFSGTPMNVNPVSIDIDDIAVSYTGYIGPIGGSAPAIPSPPQNVR